MRRTGARAQRETVGPTWKQAGHRVVAALVLGLAFASLPSRAQALAPGDVPIVFTNSRSFRIPFNVEEEIRKRIAEVHLYVSTDRGITWTYAGATEPESPAFPFRASRDGEFWFAVRTRDKEGRLYPPGEESITPKMKVVVDTDQPSVRVLVQPRRGSQASIRWEVQDSNLDLKTLTVEYQPQGAPEGAWRMVQITRRLVGEARWDAGTGLPLTVRVTVEDRAGNRQTAERVLPDGLANAPTVQNTGQGMAGAPPPIERIPYQQEEVTPRVGDPELGGNPFEGLAPDDRPPANPTVDASRNIEPPAQGGSRPGFVPERREPVATPSPGPDGVLLVGSPRFPIQYEVYEGDPSAVGVVEMWGTRDDGTNWQLLGTDPDRESPFQVDVGGEGRFGLYLVVKSSAGLGDPRPSSGTPPHMIVEVDSTAPQVQIDPPQIGTGAAAGSMLITWRASDPHLAAQPVVLSIRPDQPGAIWQQITSPIENSGRYVWALPTNLPPRFYLRVDVFDTLGNQSAAETTEPVVIQVSRPRGRILGLDPSARTNAARIR